MDDLVLTDLRAEPDTRELRALLLQLEYPPDRRQGKADQILAEYRDHREYPLLGVRSGGRLMGLIGLTLSPPVSAVIRHIVVSRDHRRQGVGRAMIRAVGTKYGLESISAETDRGAVAFYRKCGFTIQSLGEKYPGIERFCCTLDLTVQQPAPADPAERDG